ncbi:MAG TPA: nucleotidyltransferase family protein [Vicinamibacterales bacterium]|nr:nucleotidyltransferase family protein [Vicinamibacterales bacterium]
MLAAVLAGEPRLPSPDAWEPLIAEAVEQGTAPLLYAAARSLGWDGPALRSLQVRAAADAALALAQNVELGTVLEGLADAGVAVLVLKGAHLANHHYASPELRPRSDSDLLIRDADRASARECFVRLGYAPLAHVTGDVAFTQCHFTRVDAAGVRHAFDVHWRVANPRVFSSRLTWDDLAAERVPVRALPAASRAFGPSAAHALLLACLHRTAHHGNSDRLIWLYDIRLLASRLSAAEWDRLVDLAARRGVAAVLLAGLRASTRLAGARPPAGVIRRLEHLGAQRVEPDLRRFIAGRQSPLRVLVSDWRRLRGLPERAAFLREHLLPPPAYMAHKYEVGSRAALPWLYVHRLVRGCARWLRQ